MQNMKDDDTATSLAHDLLKDKRAERRWKNIRFVAWFLLIAFISISLFRLFVPSSTVATISSKGKYIALIRLNGMIAPGRSFSAEETVPLLYDAFTDKNAIGILLDIDSPGGTPVQSSIIHDAIITLKKKYHKKVIIVGEDLLTSGAYFVAVAADKIYVNPNTITGSIGVIMKGFGFVDLMKKVGVERRIITVGNDKDRLDPFLPQNPDDLKKIQVVMSEVHNNFAQAVLQGRKGKLHANPEELFSGDFWSGQTAFKLGLVDGLGNLMDVMEKEFNTHHFKEYGSMPNLFRLFGGQVGSTFDAIFNQLP
ncbi:MAG TPA: S49 family peptidase [Gammaproteobacteria bacterium]|nr:S49 family peptidase [Gammaproteobacteria bacterium]